MPSEASIAVVENAADVEGEPTQGSADLLGSSMNATQAGISLHDHDILLEQKVQRDDPMHALPQGDASPDPKKSSNSPDDIPKQTNTMVSWLFKLTDPWTTEIPMPDGDPFEYLLKPILKKDTIQCDAWKDEVQNILIFAGLFSAVVTAFIIESFKQLRPDPNDSIVGLLAHIAAKLDNPSVNGTMSISSIVSDTNFVPSRSDININIFWFISLVLSLRAALIGIVTLQWLVLSDGALILFFAGMIEFLFALRVGVAIPVTFAICVPLIFLIATTVLPILQVFILQDPFRLSINNDVPMPCPYNSPQSLIFRRICIRSKFVFAFFTTIIIVTAAYACIVQVVCLIRKFTDGELPIFRTGRKNLKLRLRDAYPQRICEILVIGHQMILAHG